MNRKEANNHIGKQIRVVDPLLGCYIGELIDIITEPRKPWRGKVKIKAIEQYPVQHLSDIKEGILTRPPFANGNVYEISGSKIEPLLTDIIETDYNASLITALVNEIHHYQVEKDKISCLLNELEAELKKVDPKYELDNSSEFDFQYYTISKDEDYVFLFDENNNQIPLDDCPFDFQIKVKNKWINAHYESDLFFIDSNKKRHQLKKGAQIRLHKEQFDPYNLLVNELEKPALDSLNSGLKKFRIDHDDCVNCHNTLLNQYLASEDQKLFKGVNFISYQKDSLTLLVQHHYEREIADDGEDITFDRFEFTNDQGKRLLMTYTTERSKRSKKEK